MVKLPAAAGDGALSVAVSLQPSATTRSRANWNTASPGHFPAEWVSRACCGAIPRGEDQTNRNALAYSGATKQQYGLGVGTSIEEAI